MHRRAFRPPPRRRPPRRAGRGATFLPITVAAFIMLIIALCRLWGCGVSAVPSRPSAAEDLPECRYTAAQLRDMLSPLFLEDGVTITALQLETGGRFILTAKADCPRLCRAEALPEAFSTVEGTAECSLTGVLSGTNGEVTTSDLTLSAGSVCAPLDGEYEAAFCALVREFLRSVCRQSGRPYSGITVEQDLLIITASPV